MPEDTTRAKVLAAIGPRAAETLNELDGYVGSTFKDDADLFRAIKNADDRIDDATHEIADGRVSVYYSAQLEWLASNLGRCDQEEAIANGAKSATDIAAWCWYEAERDDIRDDLQQISAAIPDEEDET